jgi:hypothetical protein
MTTLRHYIINALEPIIHVLNLALQFSKEWQILLFHYDGKVSEWDEYEWSQNAIHISTRKQAKWYVHF